MAINYIRFYHLFAVIIGLYFVIKQLILICRKPQNCMYFLLPYIFLIPLWIQANIVLILSEFPPVSLDVSMGDPGARISLAIGFVMHIILTLFIYILNGKYIEFHITYLPRTRRKHIRVNLDESYIIFYGLNKFKQQKIFVRDIIVEESYYGTFIEDTKIFRFAAALGSEKYFVFKLQNGKIVKIKYCPFFLYGDILELGYLSYALGIPRIKSLHKKPR